MSIFQIMTFLLVSIAQRWYGMPQLTFDCTFTNIGNKISTVACQSKLIVNKKFNIEPQDTNRLDVVMLLLYASASKLRH